MVRMLVVALGMLAVSCGSDPCEEFGNVVCERACECGDGGECRIATGGLTITSESESDCNGFYRLLVCAEDQDPVVDFEGCSAAVEAAACVATSEGMALEYPADPACEEPQ